MKVDRKFPYVQSFRDRHGFRRNYLRLPRQKIIPLPGAIGSREFVEAYERHLVRLESAPAQAKIARQAAPDDSGVYLLMKDGEITYVGTSANLRARIADHRANGRPFDKAYFILAPEDDRHELEAALIKTLKPLGNKHPGRNIKRLLVSQISRERVKRSLKILAEKENS